MTIEYSPLSPPSHIRAEADLSSDREWRVRIIVGVGLIAFLAMCLVVRLANPFDLAGYKSHGWILDHLLARLVGMVNGWSVTEMAIYPLGVLAIFTLERFYPAIPSQKTLCTAVVHDALWVVIKSGGRVVFVGAYATLLYRFYDRYLSFLTLPVAGALPLAVRLTIGLIVSELLQWIQHWLHHHVKWFWPFHAVHHAQRELNMFSQYRVHSFEYLVRRPVVLLPMLMLGLDVPEVTWWLLLTSWQVNLAHANIRTSFGPLRYLIVTPQSHRIHHSRRAEHLNHNYGSVLSVWDYLLGTQWRDYDVYPETGIDDETFPHESARSVFDMLMSPIRQLLYPFRRLCTLISSGHG